MKTIVIAETSIGRAGKTKLINGFKEVLEFYNIPNDFFSVTTGAKEYLNLFPNYTHVHTVKGLETAKGIIRNYKPYFLIDFQTSSRLSMEDIFGGYEGLNEFFTFTNSKLVFVYPIGKIVIP